MPATSCGPLRRDVCTMTAVRATLRGIAVLAAAALVTSCSVVPLPKTMAARDQSPREQDWDVKDCQA